MSATVYTCSCGAKFYRLWQLSDHIKAFNEFIHKDSPDRHRPVEPVTDRQLKASARQHLVGSNRNRVFRSW